jgi:hypothetical protein
MIDHEIERIAAAVNQLRPDWPKVSLVTLLSKPELRSRPRRDVAVALTWVACEAQSVTPARVLEAGPWWQAAGIQGTASVREPYDANTFCEHSGRPMDRCAGSDHECITAAEYAARVAADRASRRPLSELIARAEEAP